jgi:hypothetical protein
LAPEADQSVRLSLARGSSCFTASSPHRWSVVWCSDPHSAEYGIYYIVKDVKGKDGSLQTGLAIVPPKAGDTEDSKVFIGLSREKSEWLAWMPQMVTHRNDEFVFELRTKGGSVELHSDGPDMKAGASLPHTYAPAERERQTKMLPTVSNDRRVPAAEVCPGWRKQCRSVLDDASSERVGHAAPGKDLGICQRARVE